LIGGTGQQRFDIIWLDKNFLEELEWKPT